MKTRRTILALAAALATGLALGCGQPAATAPANTRAIVRTDVTAFVDVNVVPIATAGVLEHQTVLVEGGRIARVGPKDAVVVPDGANLVPGAGKYLMPGLADMHAHLPTDASGDELRRVLALFVSQGVTTVRGMRGAAGQLAFRANAREGELVPRLYLAGPPVEAALTPDAARALVREQKSAGYDLVKLLGGIDAAAYAALVDESAKAGLPLAGHVPSEIGIDTALAAHQRTIEHLMGYGASTKDAPALTALARRTREAGVYNCPTLDFFAVTYAPDDSALAKRDGLAYARTSELEEWRKQKKESPPKPGASMAPLQRLVAILAHEGAPLLVGSDSPGEYRVPGFSYVEELDDLARAGLTPAEILRAATRSAAECLGTSARAGAVEEGLLADLVLTDRDPLTNVRNVARPAGVMIAGRWLPRAELDRRIAPYRDQRAVAP